MSLRALCLTACAALLAACATQAPAPALPPVAGDPQQHQQQREAALAAMPDWSLAGRVALSNGKDGGSGRIDWSQHGRRYTVALSAPITRQSWRLSGEPGQATLEGLQGGPRQGSDAQTLLRQATRWEIPVEALAAWLRGMRADEAHFGIAGLTFGEDGRLSHMVQGGWAIEYGNWKSGAAGTDLPGRLSAVNGDARVRLVVDSWQ